MSLLPRSLAARLALILTLLLVPIYLVFFAMLRAQLTETIAPRVGQGLAMTIEECRDSLRRLPAEQGASWIARFNELGGMQLAAETAPLEVSKSPSGFVSQLQSQLRQELGDDIEVQIFRRPLSRLSVEFRTAGERRYRLDVPLERLETFGARPFLWLFISAAILIWAAVLFVIWQINRPLRRIADRLANDSGVIEPVVIPASTPLEFRRFFESFNFLCRQLDEHEAARRLVAAEVSHDLRAPLTRIRLRAEMLDDFDAAAALARDSESVAQIIDQFVDFYRDSAQLTTPAAAIDLAPKIAEVVLRYAELGNPVGFTVAGAIWLQVDPLTVERVLANLIENALAHGKPPVEVSAYREAETLLIRVYDRGAGIAAADIPRMLRPFERMDPARSAQGHCGLGLSIVQRLLIPLGGSLEFLRDADGFAAVLRLPTAGNPRNPLRI